MIPPIAVVAWIHWSAAFWHGHPDKYWQGSSGPYWDAKIERNMARDRRIDKELESAAWRVIRLWDFEVLRDPLGAARKAERELKKARLKST